MSNIFSITVYVYPFFIGVGFQPIEPAQWIVNDQPIVVED